MFYALVRPLHANYADWLCVSTHSIANGAEVDFVRNASGDAEDTRTFRGQVIGSIWISGEDTDEAKFCRQLWRGSTVGMVTGRYFRTAIPSPYTSDNEEEPGVDPLSFFPSEEELEAASAEEVLGYAE